MTWRIIKDWLNAQLALIEVGQAEMAEVFLPYALTNTGQTLFQRFTEEGALMLTAASNAAAAWWEGA